MTRLKGLLAGLLILPAASVWAASVPAPVRVASPEAVFLDVARQIGGPEVAAELVKASGRPAKPAQILIYEDSADDRWAPGALQRMPAGAIVAASALAAASRGEGPSWYDLSSMGAVGAALAKAIERAAPGEASAIETRRDGFLRALAVLKLKSKEIVDNYGGSAILLTDPRLAPFCRSLGLTVVATPAEAEAVKAAIASHKGIVLVYNVETRGGLGALKALAEDAGLPLVGLRMTLPSGLSYQQWIGREINLIHGALNEAAP
jgi:zinc/manganese transport system substrate-binding protein